MSIKIALAGNPNSGKTTLFNDLTGSSQYVGNWPGVTMEKKEGRLRGFKDILIIDLPGIYSLSPYTLEEVVARQFLVNEKPDAIINIVDGTNIERNLYLTTQLAELSIPMVVAVNMIDIVRKQKTQIDLVKLSRALGCPVVETAALKGTGSMAAAEMAIELAKSGQKDLPPPFFTGSVAQALDRIEADITTLVAPDQLRWHAVKIFERDKKEMEKLKPDSELATQLESYITTCEKEMDDDSESIITDQRYAYVTRIIHFAVKKSRVGQKMTASDRIDRIVTNRLLALPIFALIMTAIYTLSITTVGDLVTGWTNDTLFGELIIGNLHDWLESLAVTPWLTGLIVDGIIGGVGAVIGFVPQMLILFLMLSILEDVGYMTRVAFIMDRIFRRFGLSGKSFIPMLIGSGCSVPGIMASRTIEHERDRRLTIITTSFIPCGAKMPIIALFAGALFGGSSLIATSAYFIGVASVIISGIILKKTRAFSGDPAPFVMELPAYHVPAASNVLRSTWERGWSFVRRAGTIILLSSVVLWFLQAFGTTSDGFGLVEDNSVSLLAAIGSFIAPVFAPLGFGNWQATVATFTGLIAKENVVSTFGILYGFAEVAEDGAEIWPQLAAQFTVLTAYSFMVFNLLCAPCFAAIGAIRREMNSRRWTLVAVGYLTVFAYAVALVIYQIGSLIGGNGFSFGSGVAIIVLGIFAWLLLRKGPIDSSIIRAASQGAKANA